MSHSSANAGPDPSRQYTTRLQSRRTQIERARKLDRRLSWARLATVGLTVLIAALAVREAQISGWWVLAPALLFMALVVVHERVITTRERCSRVAAFLSRGLTRLEGGWAGGGEEGIQHLEAHHPYAEDLDLFGRGSLFEYLSIARTQAGQSTLAAWLQHPADPATIRQRQEALRELRDRLDLREDLALIGEILSMQLHPHKLAQWARRSVPPLPRCTPLLLIICHLLVAGALLAWLVLSAGTLPLLAALALQCLVGLALRARVREIISAAERRLCELGLLAEMMDRLEKESFATTQLRRIQGSLEGSRESPAARLRRLARLVSALEWRRNQIFAPFAAFLLWGSHFALRIESWRRAHGRSVDTWLRAFGEFEALSSLACYAFEHPETIFPEILDTETPLFDGEEIGHPLIQDEDCVRNDLRLGPERRLLVISGSNMSGKSTMLRSVGVTTILALCGAPVRARRLRLSPLIIGASIRVTDSLQDGASRFYTEIRRLRQIFDLLAEGRTLLFLLDELLQGTNSHDRLIGAEAVISGLLSRGSIGLLTTHDLALTEMTQRLGHGAENVHFEDQMTSGEIEFDYRMRPGIVRHSNALELMRAVGLEV